jgi:hypothetical protein
MLEKLTPQDRRFILCCLLAIALFGTIGVRLFYHAFPEAAIELKVDRAQAQRLAEGFLARSAGAPRGLFGGGKDGWHFASRFATDNDPKVYLERTLGLARANRLYGREARVWSWDLRWFRSAQKEEWRASLTPLGDIIGFEHVIPETTAGARLTEQEATSRANALLASLGVDPRSVTPIEATSKTLPGRTDWILVMEKRDLKMGEATVRHRVVIVGDAPGSYREFVKVPEQWQRDYRKLRSANEATGQADSLLMLLTLLAMVGVLIQKTVRGDVPWKTVTVFGGVAFVLAFLAQANSLPLTLYDYDTASPFPAFLTRQLVLAVMGALAQGLFIAIVVAAAEPLYRERFPAHVSVRGTFSARGLRTRGCFKGILLGYAMTAFFLAYQVVFYIVAARLGAWAPADVPYDDLLNTAFPWAMVLLIGFLPAVSEEFISRVFSIAFLGRYLRSRALVLVIPAVIWGFGHATYPNQPFFIRGLEVGLAGILIGGVFLRYGIVPILVWHFTVDAVYTSLLMLRSGNLYYVVSGAVAAGILLVPFGLSLVSHLRRGGFEPEAGLTNGDEGLVPAPQRREEAAVVVPAVARAPATLRNAAAVFAAACLLTLLVPARPVGEEATDVIGRSRALALAREFLASRGERPERYRCALYTGTGFAEEGGMERTRPEETGRLAGFSRDAASYVLQQEGASAFRRLAGRNLPLGLWVARFYRPGEKAEWKVAVESRTGRVIQFSHPIEEAAPAPAPPSLEEAERRMLAEAARLGYPVEAYAVIDTGVQARPRRVDTRVTLESRSDAVGEARPRLTGVFHGDQLAALWPSLKVPEAFLRQRESRGTFYWVGVVARVAAGGCLLSVLLVVAIGAIRSEGLRWRRLVPPLLVWLLLAAFASLNAWPTFWRMYQTEIPLETYQATLFLGLIFRILLAGVTGLVVFALLEKACPAWRTALRRAGTWRDACVRAVIAVVGFAGLHQLSRILADRFPAAFEVQGFLPASLEFYSAGYEACFSGAQRLLVLAGAAAAACLVLREPRFARPRYRWVAAALAVILIVPTDAKTVGEMIGPFVVSFLALGWTVIAILLLRDHAAAWVLYGACAVAAGGAMGLLRQPLPDDRLQGVLAVALAAMVAVALTAGRRRPVEALAD